MVNGSHSFRKRRLQHETESELVTPHLLVQSGFSSGPYYGATIETASSDPQDENIERQRANADPAPLGIVGLVDVPFR
jgi:hypothetical protein